jgi:hypothetical protein
MRLARRTVAVSLMTLTALACAPYAERTLLTEFFAASRLRDLTALRKFSSVVFEPASDGIVTSFEISGVTAVRGLDGLAVSEDISIAAPVRLPDGQTVLKTFVVTMARSRTGAQDADSGWMITAISERPASPSIPRP